MVLHKSNDCFFTPLVTWPLFLTSEKIQYTIFMQYFNAPVIKTTPPPLGLLGGSNINLQGEKGDPEF